MLILDIYKYLSLSKLSILGYSSRYERMKDEIISNLNHIVLNEPNKPTIESLIRNNKINQALDYDKEDYEYLIVDIIHLKSHSDGSHFLNTKYKRRQIDRLLELSGRYKILLTCQMYKSFEDFKKINVSNDLLYMCDFAFSVGQEIKIIKNRWRLENAHN